MVRQIFIFVFFLNVCRRAHLKECFETLKKNVPNVDEKKTSNLSVLRSALRYIQVSRSNILEKTHYLLVSAIFLLLWAKAPLFLSG